MLTFRSRAARAEDAENEEEEAPSDSGLGGGDFAGDDQDEANDHASNNDDGNYDADHGSNVGEQDDEDDRSSKIGERNEEGDQDDDDGQADDQDGKNPEKAQKSQGSNRQGSPASISSSKYITADEDEHTGDKNKAKRKKRKASAALAASDPNYGTTYGMPERRAEADEETDDEFDIEKSHCYACQTSYSPKTPLLQCLGLETQGLRRCHTVFCSGPGCHIPGPGYDYCVPCWVRLTRAENFMVVSC